MDNKEFSKILLTEASELLNEGARYRKEKIKSKEVSAAENPRFIAKESSRKFDTSNNR